MPSTPFAYAQVISRIFASFHVLKSRISAGQRNFCGEFDSRQLHQKGRRDVALFLWIRSSDLYDDLALCAPLLDVGQGFGGRFEGKDPIYDWAYSAGIDERAELA